MTRMTQYVDAFWEADFTSTKGFDILAKRNKDIRKVSKEIEEYYKERAKAESAYSKAIQGIARKLEGKEEIGDLGRSIRELKTQTERISRTHDEAANNFQMLYQEITKFNEEQKQAKSQREERTKSQQNDKNQKHKNCMQCKEKYRIRCKELENAEETYNQARQSVQTPGKELAKITKSKDKATEEKQKADAIYRSTVVSLENSRKVWEKEMEETCKHFQQLEEERINFYRDNLWKSTNIDSKACVEHDESAEAVRNCLQYCDISKDIQEFLDNNRLTGKRPVEIEYENYHRKESSPPANVISNRPPMPTPSRPPLPVPQKPKEAPLISLEEEACITDDPHYAAAGPASTGEYSYARVHTPFFPDSKGTQSSTLTQGSPVAIIKSYHAKSPSEVSVDINEEVQFVKPMRDGMAQVIHNGRHGLVPMTCIRLGTVTYL